MDASEPVMVQVWRFEIMEIFGPRRGRATPNDDKRKPIWIGKKVNRVLEGSEPLNGRVL